jgi:hypothetical protein
MTSTVVNGIQVGNDVVKSLKTATTADTTIEFVSSDESVIISPIANESKIDFKAGSGLIEKFTFAEMCEGDENMFNHNFSGTGIMHVLSERSRYRVFTESSLDESYRGNIRRSWILVNIVPIVEEYFRDNISGSVNPVPMTIYFGSLSQMDNRIGISVSYNIEEGQYLEVGFSNMPGSTFIQMCRPFYYISNNDDKVWTDSLLINGKIPLYAPPDKAVSYGQVMQIVRGPSDSSSLTDDLIWGFLESFSLVNEYFPMRNV